MRLYWIRGDTYNRHLLLETGVKLGFYYLSEWRFCIVSSEALQKLEPLWPDTFVWGVE